MSFAERFNSIKNNAGNVDTSFEEKGTIGGVSKFKIEEDGVYDVVIDMVAFKESKASGSAWYDITFKTEGGAKINDKLFVLNKDGQPYNIDKNGQKKSTYGWNRMAALNFLTNGEWDGLPIPEEKEIMVYDYDLSAEVAKVVPIVPSMIGKALTVGIKMQLEDGYPDETVSRTVPTIRVFCDAISHQSATEKRSGIDASVINDFKKSIESNSEPIDKRVKSKANGNTTQPKTTSGSSAPTGFNFSK